MRTPSPGKKHRKCATRFPASSIRKCKRKWQPERYRSKWIRNPQERQKRSLMISQRACGTCSNDRLLKSKNDLAGIQTRQGRYGGAENIFSRNPSPRYTLRPRRSPARLRSNPKPCRFFAFMHGVSRNLRQKPEAYPVGIILANLLQIKENRKLKFILPMLYYIDGV